MWSLKGLVKKVWLWRWWWKEEEDEGEGEECREKLESLRIRERIEVEKWKKDVHEGEAVAVGY